MFKRLALLLSLCSTLYGITVTSQTEISGTGLDSNPKLALSPAGPAMALWTQNNPFQVETAYFTGTTWLSPFVIDSGTFPQIAIDQSGNAIAVWLKNPSNLISNPTQVFTSRFDAATLTWSPPFQLSNEQFPAATPQIAMNLQGNAIAIWITSNPQQIRAATFSVTTGAWSTPTTLVLGSGSFPQVELDESNQATVLWLNSNFLVNATTALIP